MEIDRKTSALLVMDLQHDIVAPTGVFGAQGPAAAVAQAGVLNTCAQALHTARSAGLPVIHVGVATREGQAINTSSAQLAPLAEHGVLDAGSPGCAFMAEVAPIPGEFIVMKAAISAFAGTDLDAHLRNSGIRHLILCGFATNFVIEGTARQAVDAGYAVTILTDGCCSFDPRWHATSLEVLALLTTLTTTTELAVTLAK